jgi:hypothetical protein
MLSKTWNRDKETPPVQPKIAGAKRYLSNGRLVWLEWNGKDWSCWMIPTAHVELSADQIAEAEKQAVPALIAAMEQEIQVLRETMNQENQT